MQNTEHEYFGDVPKSSGIHPATLYIVALAIIGCIAVGTTVVHFATYGHVWPAQNSQRVPLDSSSVQ
jgi:hypothetical protein